MESITVRREREANWTQEEKDLLRKLISRHQAVIDDKGNDSKMITKKRVVWLNIRKNMQALGYNRDITKLKQQWNRMKTQAKNNLAAARKARNAARNYVSIPKLDEIEEKPINTIKVEVFEDTDFIDSNSDPQTILQFQEEELHIQSPIEEMLAQSEQSLNEQQTEPLEKPKPQHRRQRLRNLPKHNGKYSVLEERLNQIRKQTEQSEEMHKLQMENIRAEISHKEEIHILNKQHLRELHELKKKLLLNQFQNSNTNGLE